jgi:hypothetical protein
VNWPATQVSLTVRGRNAYESIRRILMVFVVTSGCLAAEKATGPDLSTPKSGVISFRDAVLRRDWRTAEACLASGLREVLKDAVSDGTFFDQYVTDGSGTKTLELLPANRVTDKGLAEFGLPTSFAWSSKMYRALAVLGFAAVIAVSRSPAQLAEFGKALGLEVIDEA